MAPQPAQRTAVPALFRPAQLPDSSPGLSARIRPVPLTCIRMPATVAIVGSSCSVVVHVTGAACREGECRDECRRD